MATTFKEFKEICADRETSTMVMGQIIGVDFRGIVFIHVG
jgi:hypothetical protein